MVNTDTPQSGYFRKIATVLLRLFAVGYAIHSLCIALYQLSWSSDTWQGWITPVFELLAAVVLWTFSARIAQAVARGLDERE